MAGSKLTTGWLSVHEVGRYTAVLGKHPSILHNKAVPLFRGVFFQSRLSGKGMVSANCIYLGRGTFYIHAPGQLWQIITGLHFQVNPSFHECSLSDICKIIASHSSSVWMHQTLDPEEAKQTVLWGPGACKLWSPGARPASSDHSVFGPDQRPGLHSWLNQLCVFPIKEADGVDFCSWMHLNTCRTNLFTIDFSIS